MQLFLIWNHIIWLLQTTVRLISICKSKVSPLSNQNKAHRNQRDQTSSPHHQKKKREEKKTASAISGPRIWSLHIGSPTVDHRGERSGLVGDAGCLTVNAPPLTLNWAILWTCAPNIMSWLLFCCYTHTTYEEYNKIYLAITVTWSVSNWWRMVGNDKLFKIDIFVSFG